MRRRPVAAAGRVDAVAIRKICGIETEYGIVLRGAGESNPIAASSLLINAYVHDLEPRRGAGAQGRLGLRGRVARQRRPRASRPTARMAARGRDPPRQRRAHQRRPLLRRPRPPRAAPRPSAPTPCERGRVRPGGRADPRSGRWRRPAALLPAGPGDRRLQEQLRRQGQLLRLPRELPDGPGRCPSAASSPTSCRTSSPARSSPGAGKVGQRGAGRRRRARCRSSSPSGPTSSRRRSASRPRSSGPIVNTRDEPHADAQKYRRLHVIVGDANLSEVATFLKVGTTALVLAMIEDDVLPPRPRARRARCRRCARCPTTSRCASRSSWPTARRITALEIQWELLDRARKYAEDRGPRGRRRGGRAEQSCAAGRHVLTGLESDPMSLADQLDWVAKYRLLDGYRERHGLDWDDARLAAMDLQYHDLRPEQVAVRPARPRAARRPTTRSTAAMTEPPDRHPGLLPGQVPPAVGRRHRGRQLGLAGVRRRRRPAAPGADDGTAHVEPRPTSVALLDECATPGRAAGAAGRPERTEGHEQPWLNESRRRSRPRRAATRRSSRRRPPPSEQGEKIKAELDDLLDEIDEVLEDNAEDFVKSYVQKGRPVVRQACRSTICMSTTSLVRGAHEDVQDLRRGPSRSTSSMRPGRGRRATTARRADDVAQRDTRQADGRDRRLQAWQRRTRSGCVRRVQGDAQSRPR